MHKNVDHLTHDDVQLSDKDYLLVLGELVGMTKSHPHLVSAIGIVNFDSEHMEEACEYLIARTGHVGIVSNQVQVSTKAIHSLVILTSSG